MLAFYQQAQIMIYIFQVTTYEVAILIKKKHKQPTILIFYDNENRIFMQIQFYSSFMGAASHLKDHCGSSSHNVADSSYKFLV